MNTSTCTNRYASADMGLILDHGTTPPHPTLSPSGGEGRRAKRGGQKRKPSPQGGEGRVRVVLHHEAVSPNRFAHGQHAFGMLRLNDGRPRTPAAHCAASCRPLPRVAAPRPTRLAWAASPPGPSRSPFDGIPRTSPW